MKMRNRLAAGLLCAVLAAALTVPASAHCGNGHRGWHHRTYAENAVVAVCPYDDCTVYGRHLHDGVAYCGCGGEDGFCVCASQGCGHHGCW